MSSINFNTILIRTLLLILLVGVIAIGTNFVMKQVAASRAERLSDCSQLVDQVLEEEQKERNGDHYAKGVQKGLLSKIDDRCRDIYSKLREEKHVSTCRASREQFQKSLGMADAGNVFAEMSISEDAADLIKICPELKTEVEQALSKHHRHGATTDH